MKDKRKVSPIRESDLYALWHGLCVAQSTTSDRRLRGIHSGRLNLVCGPDYRGAEFDLDGRRYRGDVEIHTRRADWIRHGHHLDWRYDNVQLHLVADEVPSGGEYVSTSKGQTIPTVSFEKFPHIVCDGDLVLRCRAQKNNLIDPDLSLQAMSLRRLHEKANLFYCASMGDGMDQAMYRALMRMLGRGQNADNFERLALMMPWSTIRLIKKRWHPTRQQWQHLFIYLAGLGGSINDRQFPAVTGVTDQPVLPAHIWQLAGQRPFAYPAMRLRGLADFIHFFTQPELYLYFLEQTTRRSPFPECFARLQSTMLPYSDDNSGTFWGKSLITEIIGNVIIPGLYSYAESTASAGFTSYLEDLYFWLPATSSYGCLKNYQTWPEWTALPKKFYVRQGLLWLHKNYCCSALCDHCPLGRIAETN